MATTITTQQARQGHKYAESTDSEVSFFDVSGSSTPDSWSGYFEGWEQQNPQARDNYCPQIAASTETSPVRAGHASTPAHKFTDYDDDLLPTACPHRRHRSEGHHNERHQNQEKTHRRRGTISTKRFGMVAAADPHPGDVAITQMNTSLLNSMSNTEDILSAMYNPNWDVASLQKWYHASAQTPADLALFKIMFSLRYTVEDVIPSS